MGHDKVWAEALPIQTLWSSSVGTWGALEGSQGWGKRCGKSGPKMNSCIHVIVVIVISVVSIPPPMIEEEHDVLNKPTAKPAGAHSASRLHVPDTAKADLGAYSIPYAGGVHAGAMLSFSPLPCCPCVCVTSTHKYHDAAACAGSRAAMLSRGRAHGDCAVEYLLAVGLIGEELLPHSLSTTCLGLGI